MKKINWKGWTKRKSSGGIGCLAIAKQYYNRLFIFPNGASPEIDEISANKYSRVDPISFRVIFR